MAGTQLSLTMRRAACQASVAPRQRQGRSRQPWKGPSGPGAPEPDPGLGGEGKEGTGDWEVLRAERTPPLLRGPWGPQGFTPLLDLLGEGNKNKMGNSGPPRPLPWRPGKPMPARVMPAAGEVPVGTLPSSRREPRKMAGQLPALHRLPPTSGLTVGLAPHLHKGAFSPPSPPAPLGSPLLGRVTSVLLSRGPISESSVVHSARPI